MSKYGTFKAGNAEMNVQINGLGDFLERLEQLPIQMQKNAVGSSLRAACKPIAAAAKVKAAATGDPGSDALAESIGIKGISKKKLKRNQVSAMLVGPIRANAKALIMYLEYYGRTLSGKSAKAGIRHGHLVEFGTDTMPAQPFLRPAFDANVGKAIAIFRETLGKKTDGIIRKLNKRAASK